MIVDPSIAVAVARANRERRKNGDYTHVRALRDSSSVRRRNM
jgi:hypothetical protein